LDVDECKIAVVDLFPEYVFEPKDTIFKSWYYGGKSEYITLGVYEVDTIRLNVFTEFRRIPFVDGMRGKSMLCLVSMEKDTLIFLAEMPEELPIDIYKNNFVFLSQNNEYEFSELQLVLDEAACFKVDNHKCFWAW
jgi:hypothetical protein